MALESVICGNPFTLVAAGTIGPNTLVTIDTNGKAAHCGAGGIAVGVVYDQFTAGQAATVYPIQGRHLVYSSATITAADFLKPAASGQVAPEAGVTTRTADTVGQAETSVSGSGLFWAQLGA